MSDMTAPEACCAVRDRRRATSSCETGWKVARVEAPPTLPSRDSRGRRSRENIWAPVIPRKPTLCAMG